MAHKLNILATLVVVLCVSSGVLASPFFAHARATHLAAPAGLIKLGQNNAAPNAHATGALLLALLAKLKALAKKIKNHLPHHPKTPTPHPPTPTTPTTVPTPEPTGFPRDPEPPFPENDDTGDINTAWFAWLVKQELNYLEYNGIN